MKRHSTRWKGWRTGRQKLGFVGVQIPSWDSRLFDLKLAAESQAYCDEVLGVLHAGGAGAHGAFNASAGPAGGQPPGLRFAAGGICSGGIGGRRKGAQAWAVQQLEWAAKASRNLGLTAHATFSGALAWPFFYPWPQRPAGLIRRGISGIGSAVAAHPQRFRRSRRGCLLRAASRRGPARWRNL